MSSTQMKKEVTTPVATAAAVDLKLEVVVMPVADVERSKQFYGGLGWRLDADFSGEAGWRAIQMTPPGSPCSIQFGTSMTTAAPGSAQGTYLVVDDLEAAIAELSALGVEVSGPFHFEAFGAPPVPGRDPQNHPYNAYAAFKDPDGNGWLLQEVTTRLPGRGLPLNLTNMISLLREAEEKHGEYEPKGPKHHWSEWYGTYILSRSRGRTSEEAFADGVRRIEGAKA